VISNRYGFIFTHIPKTGGTSILTTLHEDTEQECEIVYEKNGEGIAAVFPNKNDFPWWDAWVDKEQQTVEHRRLYRQQKGIPHSRLVHTDTVNVIFSPTSPLEYVGNGNIKHLPLAMWNVLMQDRRFQLYRTFAHTYRAVATCRNPYTREFSFFLYENDNALKHIIQNSKKEQISNKIKTLWTEWAKKTLCTHENSQYKFIVNDSGIYPHLIRLEYMEKDYNEFCEIAGIKRKTAEIPHKLDNKTKLKNYLPKNILEWYNNELLSLIHKNRSDDFENLPYEKGSLK
jgi:hypothetical protein